MPLPRTKKPLVITPLVIEGWYNATRPAKKDEEDSKLDKTISKVILQKDLLYTARRHEVRDLTITEIKKIQGSFFNPVYVRGIADLKRDGQLFFVDERKIPRLQELLKQAPAGDKL